jgi:ADP-heptose:LPS heptosyltransferase
MAVVRHLRSYEMRPHVLVMAAPQDADAAVRIAGSSGARAVVPKLRDAFALVALADAVFTPDTSISHAASAFRKPAVVMMISGMNIFEPYQTPGRSLYSDGPTLASVSVESALAALDETLGGWRRPIPTC